MTKNEILAQQQQLLQLATSAADPSVTDVQALWRRLGLVYGQVTEFRRRLETENFARR
jgi:hypothetical protein